MIVAIVIVVVGMLLLITHRAGWWRGARMPLAAGIPQGVWNTLGHATQHAHFYRVLALMAAFAVLEFALYQSHWLPKMFEWPGILHIPFYAFVAIVIFAVDSQLQDYPKARTAAWYVIIAGLAVLGLSHIWSADDIRASWRKGEQIYYPTPPVRVVTAPKPTRTTQCPGEVIPLPLGSNWTELPNGNNCRFAGEIEAGEVEFADYKGTYKADGWQNRIPIRARAKSGQAFMRISWCPTHTGTVPINWDCTPK